MQSLPNNPNLRLLLAFLFTFYLGHSNAQDYIINNYKVNLELTTEGDFIIHENLDVEFLKESRGIQRFVPKKVKHNNATKKIKLKDVSVKDDKFSIHSNGNNKIIRIGDKDVYIKGNKSYDYSFTVSNALLFENEHIELLYNVIAEWDVPIKNVSYAITLPQTVNIPFNDFKVITGQKKEDERNATIEKNGMTFFGKSLKPLQPNDNITVAIKLPFGYIQAPPPPVPIYKKDKLWAIPLAFLGLLISFFVGQRKEENDHNTKDRQFPPDGFSPAEVGTYYDGYFNAEDAISLLPFWANKGYISITNNNLEGEENDIYFRKEKDLDQYAPHYQHIVFNGLFEKDTMVMLSELNNEIYRSYHKAGKEIKENLKDKALYDQDYHKRFKTGKLIILFFVLTIVAVLLFVFTPYILTGMMSIVAGLVAFIFHFLPSKKSKKGIQIKNHLIGFRHFLKNIDAKQTSQLLNKYPDYFEKVFPYAVAFGLDQSWLEKIKTLDLDAPSWYGYQGVHVGQTASMTSFSNEFSIPTIKSVFTSSPTSAGGSPGGGFSGGSAGGGFGGGGSSW